MTPQLINFFTAGADEVKAWTLRVGTALSRTSRQAMHYRGAHFPFGLGLGFGLATGGQDGARGGGADPL